MGQRSDPWPTVPGQFHTHLGPKFDRGHREISLIGDDSGHWPGLRQETCRGIWREGIRRYRACAVIAERIGPTPGVFLAGLHRAERVITERLTRLVSGPLPWPRIDAEKAIPWIEQRTGL